MSKALSSIVVILWSLFISYNTYGQSKFSLKWGREFKGVEKAHVTGVLKVDEGGYLLKGTWDRGEYGQGHAQPEYLQRITKQLTQKAVWEYPEKNKTETETIYFEKFVTLKSGMFMFETGVNKKSEEDVLYVKKVQDEKPSVESKKIELMSVPHGKKEYGSDFRIDYSFEGTKVLVLNKHRVKNKEPEQFDLIVYDDAFNVVWKKAVLLPYPNDKFYIESWMVDDDANVYIVGKQIDNVSVGFFSGRQVEGHYVVLAYNDNGKKEISMDLGFDSNSFIKSVDMKIIEKNVIDVVGFYSKEKAGAGTDGVFTLTMDLNTKQNSKIRQEPFPFEIVSMDMSEKKKERAKKKEDDGKKDYELPQYEMDEVILNDDGSRTILAENSYLVVTTHNTSNGGTYTTYTYYNNNVLVINVDKEGKFEWFAVVPKKQITSNDDGINSGYSYLKKDGTLYILYNEHIENLQRDYGNYRNIVFTGDKAILALATISPTGKVTREIACHVDKLAVDLRPRIFQQINDKEILMIGRYKDLEQYGVFTVK
jgi:hypothetical protein